jgi:hypothetical protein
MKRQRNMSVAFVSGDTGNKGKPAAFPIGRAIAFSRPSVAQSPNLRQAFGIPFVAPSGGRGARDITPITYGALSHARRHSASAFPVCGKLHARAESSNRHADSSSISFLNSFPINHRHRHQIYPFEKVLARWGELGRAHERGFVASSNGGAT